MGRVDCLIGQEHFWNKFYSALFLAKFAITNPTRENLENETGTNSEKKETHKEQIRFNPKTRSLSTDKDKTTSLRQQQSIMYRPQNEVKWSKPTVEDTYKSPWETIRGKSTGNICHRHIRTPNAPRARL